MPIMYSRVPAVADNGPVNPSSLSGNLGLHLIISVLVAAVAISNQSFWIDEVQTVWKAGQFSLQQWWREMLAIGGSDLQMPLYMIYTWGWEKIFGQSEWWMRAANIPWFVLGLLVFARGRVELVIATASSAFVWYCLDEARPYGMQLGTSMLVFGILTGLYDTGSVAPHRPSSSMVIALAAGLVVLSGSSLLGMIWAGAAVVSVLVALPWSRTQELLRGHWVVWPVAACVIAVLGIYYIWTLQLGARASSIGATDARNIAFILYELLGFSGLGPGRLEIRADGIKAFHPFVVPLGLYGAMLTAILAVGLQTLWKLTSWRVLLGCSMVVGGTAAFILAVGYVTDFRVLGRHFTPLMPLVLLGVGEGLRSCWQWKTRLSQMLVIGFVILSLASCFSFRLATRHAKDDYRTAAHFAQQALAKRETVWWNADPNSGLFYGVSVSEIGPEVAQGHAILILNPAQSETLNQLPAPHLVLASKADVYDNRGILAAYLIGNNFRKVINFPAFTIWADERSDFRHIDVQYPISF